MHTLFQACPFSALRTAFRTFPGAVKKTPRHLPAFLILSLILAFPAHVAGTGDPPKVSAVNVYRVHDGHARPIPVTRLVHVELERVLDGVNQLAGSSLRQLPAEYLLFRFPSPVVLSGSPVGHPIREIAVTLPRSGWDPPRLLIRNGQNQWVEYRTTRPLTVLVDQLKEKHL